MESTHEQAEVAIAHGDKWLLIFLMVTSASVGAILGSLPLSATPLLLLTVHVMPKFLRASKLQKEEEKKRERVR